MLLLILTGILGTVYGTIGIDVSIIYKHRVDRDFILVNELHSKETIEGNKKVFIRMRNGWGISLRAAFLTKDRQYGPSSKITLPGLIFDQEGDTVMEFKGARTITELYHPLIYNYEDKKQLIEIKILPEVL